MEIIQNNVKPRISITVNSLEVEKPSGGGKGPKVPYYVQVMVDGREALMLTRDRFKHTGQMQTFIDEMERVRRDAQEALKNEK